MNSSPHEFDKSNLRQTIIDSPKQFEVGFGLADGIKLEGDFSRIVFYGEGGSAFPSQLLEIIVRDYLERNGFSKMIPMVTNHGYHLIPESKDSATLNIFASYSGNTEETVSTMQAAVGEKLSAIALASGGEIEKIAGDNGIPFVKLPIPNEGFQPRMGTGYFVASMAQILENHGLVTGLVDEMKKSVSAIGKDMDDVEKKGVRLAGKIEGKTPVIYANEKYARLAMVWKIKFNEHAKNPAFWNFFSELNHNEMIGFSNLGDKYFLIMLRDDEDDDRNLKRYEVTADLVGKKGVESEQLELAGKNTFERIFNSLIFADFTAYYLSEKNKVDPTPVEMVEDFKSKLKS
ncbi:MAG TPA: SIS domain-containing protein [Candidatus Saccharimonadales bacterium]|nr:SIS domain-containing protein [Candidatus Saccharimonadales bacterium]